MRAVDLIRRKRDGAALDRAEIDFLVTGLLSGEVPDYQLSAWLMAVVWRGMTDDETLWLTDAMVRSGARADFSDVPRVKADKHSTGGVGDKVSLVLVPLAAACGLAVPKMSGHGLGHTGGTLDKLESIPGFQTSLHLDAVRRALHTVGCCLVGQSDELAPADRAIYRLRDVTATIDSIPLIAASIMSKKLVEGLDALVLDVKVGRGAFMKTEVEARRLARALVAIGTRAGVATEAVISRMDSPLGRTIGNALEVGEAIATLHGSGPPDVEMLSIELTARLLRLAGTVASDDEGRRRAREALMSGASLETWRALVSNQGGDSRCIDDPGLLPAAPHRTVVPAAASGFVSGLDAGRLGRCAMTLGAGRARADDRIDHGAGIVLHAVAGDRVGEGDAVLELHHAGSAPPDDALELARQAIAITETEPPARPLVIDSVSEHGVATP